MPERFVSFLGGVPFLLITKQSDGNHASVNWARIVEALIIAILGGLLSGYIAVQKLEVKFDLLSEQTKQTQEQLFNHVNSKP